MRRGGEGRRGEEEGRWRSSTHSAFPQVLTSNVAGMFVLRVFQNQPAVQSWKKWEDGRGRKDGRTSYQMEIA